MSLREFFASLWHHPRIGHARADEDDFHAPARTA
jgi:hypothetical protein